jgi:mono/diheme cytochrome c family protein
MATYRSTLPLGGSIGMAFAMAVTIGAQTSPAQKPNVVSKASTPIVSAEGKDNFEEYCAVCHGADGKGNGPAAPAMKSPVPDLTAMARRNNGKFDAAHAENVIRNAGSLPTPAHGVQTMPIWGSVFKSEDQSRATLRIKNLVAYLRSIQQPAAK